VSSSQLTKDPDRVRSFGGYNTSEENRQRHTALKSDVRKAGYGFIEGRHVDETSLLVVGKSGDDGGALLGHLKHLGKKYGQD
jgi:hypothetical protein